MSSRRRTTAKVAKPIDNVNALDVKYPADKPGESVHVKPANEVSQPYYRKSAPSKVEEPAEPTKEPQNRVPQKPVVNKEALYATLMAIKKQLDDIQDNEKAVEEVLKPQEAPKALEIEIGESFYSVPLLGTVPHPMLEGTEHATEIRVGSQAWLTTYDQLIAHGASKKIISDFIDFSAAVVKRDALYDVTEKLSDGTRVNRVHQFSQVWFDPVRHSVKVNEAIKKLLGDIRTQHPEAFRPNNWEELYQGKATVPKGPPKPVDFFVKVKHNGVEKEHKFENILRHFTVPVRKIQGVDKDGKALYDWECTYPKGTNPIPSEHRTELQNIYDMVPYKFVDPKDWQTYMLALHAAEKTISDADVPAELRLPKEAVQVDLTGRYCITVSDEADRSYRLSKVVVTLENRNCPQFGDEITLREWISTCDAFTKTKDVDMYPLIHVILNVEAPAVSSQFTKQSEYNKLVYTANHFDGQLHHRLSADAPVKLFRQLLLQEYADAKPEEGFGKCQEKFRSNVYADVRSTAIGKALPTKMPAAYQSVLDTLFTMGGRERSCYDPSKPAGRTQTINFGPVPFKKDEIIRMNRAELRKLALTPASNRISIPKN
jgi:hypothetical protein